ncbi:hypothetical protein KP79_PYT11828 [Mizuhopecten yessoensis]|uniref:Uncharacterized protein n=1 Tax=Mizuhopecten yessoensis TaxID=6573 RepID=A0A210QHZ1_MIZYE|nr:hypothetical protein KP79_PYT11828 [Mizuhopecten yessoensis]
MHGSRIEGVVHYKMNWPTEKSMHYPEGPCIGPAAESMALMMYMYKVLLSIMISSYTQRAPDSHTHVFGTASLQFKCISVIWLSVKALKRNFSFRNTAMCKLLP